MDRDGQNGADIGKKADQKCMSDVRMDLMGVSTLDKQVFKKCTEKSKQLDSELLCAAFKSH